jgi:hypothetical protein
VSIVGEFFGGPRDGERLVLRPGTQFITIAVLLDDFGKVQDMSHMPDQELRIATLNVEVRYGPDPDGKVYLVWPKEN